MTAKDLKNALLQEAVQGKLVPQIASEGNARDLLEQIRKERGESLPLAAERKRSSATPSAGTPRNAPLPISEDEIPFDIPESWCWCRLGELGDFTRGSGIKRDETTKEGLPCVRYGEMYTTYKIRFTKTKSFTSKSVFEKCHKIHTNDILMALTGENKWDIALAAVYEGTDELAMGGDLCKFTPNNCYSLFLVYLINSPYGIEYKRNTSTGDIIVHTSTSKLGNLLIPLPPLAEQKRIVEAIEKFMPLIEEYGKKEAVLKELNANIGTLTKKAILQEAVQGKLVPQIPAEGNAKDLLEQIKAEKAKLIKEGKIKKEKPLPEITEEVIPFDIPEGWCWCRLGELGAPVEHSFADGPFGSDLKSIHYTNKPEVRIIQLSNIGEDGWKEKNTKYTTFEHLKNIARSEVSSGNIVIAKMMPAGRAIIVPELGTKFVLSSDAVKFVPSELLDKKFLYYAINSNQFKEQVYGEVQGITRVRTSLLKLKNYLLPIPPLAEQKRIVAAIEQLLPLCEKLGK